MELIIYPIAIAYFIWLHCRDKSAAAASGTSIEITGTAAIERDEQGSITTIRINLD